MVARYFQWRQLDATRNALNSWCYWMLRKGGLSANAATNALLNKTVSERTKFYLVVVLILTMFLHGRNMELVFFSGRRFYVKAITQ